jgi:hypothetical protein
MQRDKTIGRTYGTRTYVATPTADESCKGVFSIENPQYIIVFFRTKTGKVQRD